MNPFRWNSDPRSKDFLHHLASSMYRSTRVAGPWYLAPGLVIHCTLRGIPIHFAVGRSIPRNICLQKAFFIVDVEVRASLLVLFRAIARILPLLPALLTRALRLILFLLLLLTPITARIFILIVLIILILRPGK